MNNKLQFISLTEVLELVPLSKTTIYDKMKKGEFPPKISISGNTTAFLKSEIEYFLVSKILNKSDKEIVEKILEKREEDFKPLLAMYA